ncbi:MAG: bifunctional N-acetylglucosamine-1-phosphate uridyltransferase/glucosamine-1-phosphate acetyltransferase [Elusimicrobia bacterium]|nr:bifunctional N-acetylglucosamine-1-phosphate uridyltransferase/glucosamine-1-phosphate acetyltransferase [Elusimicrobiota bacterium]
MASSPAPHIVVLAGGAGARMRIGHPKALHPVFFRPMIHHVLDAAEALERASIRLVVGRGEREFREQCRGYKDLSIVRQESPLGTADAVRAAGLAPGPDGDVLILYGDVPLLTAGTLRELTARHAASGAGCTVGRAAGPEGRAVAHCYRLKDLPAALEGAGDLRVPRGAAEFVLPDPAEALDVDDLHELWRAETALRERYNRELMLKGTVLQDPRTTLIDPRCRIGPDVRIEGGCTVIDSVLGAGVRVEGFCRIVDSEVGAGSLILQGTLAEQARVGRDCRVGPYAHLRPGTRLQDDVWLGNFVELKNASLGSGTRAAHQCYIGDAQVGRKVSIGAGFITSSSSAGPLKQRTIIEDEVVVGGASQTIAPVTLGAGSFVATGTSVTEDAPPDSFVIGRSRQVTKPGYSKKYGKAKEPGAPR